MARPVHFELPVEDQARAAAFYEKVFDWDIQQWEGAPYWLATTGPDSEAGINGALGQKSEDFAVPVFVIEVPDIEAAIVTVQEAGATITHPKNPIPGVGYAAYFDDTEGNRIGLFETDESATAD
jgi:predicted enzyme related to lactoylglutathione lyase